jgi:hypothetical protein
MNTLSAFRQCRGSVLITTLVIALLVALTVSAVLFVAREHSYLTARARTWSSEVPIAEAGIEEAMAFLNSRPATLAQDGWSLSGTNYVKSRSLTNSYFYSSIYQATPSSTATLVSIGYARIPRATNYTRRTVMALAKLSSPGWGFVAKTTVSMNGNPYVDSYDSSDDRYSSNHYYTVSKRRDRVGVSSTSALRPAITTGGGIIYGSAATAPGGNVTGNVGDGIWLQTHSGQQPDHVTDDFNMAIPDVVFPPPGWNPQSSLLLGINQLVGGITYNYVLTAGDWRFDGNVSPSGMGVLVQGKVRVYFHDNFTMNGSTAVTLAPGATLEIYMGGTMDLTGNCVVNPTGIPANCKIYGLNTCTDMKYAGTSAAFAQMYAPYADVRIIGNADFSGSIVAQSLLFSGTANIHYDEALRSDGPDWRVVSWEEL